MGQWRFSAGERGVNRVNVYERPDAVSIFIEWWDDGKRVQKALTNLTGVPVTDRELAKDIAKDVAEDRKKIMEGRASSLWRGYQPDRTLGQLFERYFADKWEGWSEGHQDSQRRYRAFWEGELGEGKMLVEVTPGRVENVAAKAAERESWSPRTERGYLQFIVTAFRYAEKKLKWIDARHNLTPVDLPSPTRKRKRLTYTKDEALALLDALHGVDERAGVFGEVAFATGRRLNAIRNLAKADYTDEGDVGVLRFRADTDKAGKEGEAIIMGRAKAGLEALLARFNEGPWVFPRLTDPERPIRDERLNELLHEAEDEAGIEHVQGRAWHAFKRLAATLAANHPGAKHQFNTRRETLEKIYEQDDRDPKVRLAEVLAAEREGDV